MGITLNQLVNQFRDIANRSPFINDFGFGNTHEIGNVRSMTYPYMWLTSQPSRIVGNSGMFTEVEIDFTIILADYLNDKVSIERGQENKNGLEIQSDMQQVLFDTIAELNQHPFYKNNRIMIKNDITFSPSYDDRDDRVNAISADITITMPFTHSYCYDANKTLSATASLNRNC